MCSCAQGPHNMPVAFLIFIFYQCVQFCHRHWQNLLLTAQAVTQLLQRACSKNAILIRHGCRLVRVVMQSSSSLAIAPQETSVMSSDRLPNTHMMLTTVNVNIQVKSLTKSNNSTHRHTYTHARTHSYSLCILCREQLFHSASGWAAWTDKCSCQHSMQAKEEVSDETNNTLRILPCGVSPGRIKGQCSKKGWGVGGKSNLMCHMEYFTNPWDKKNPGPSEQQHVENVPNREDAKKSNLDFFLVRLTQNEPTRLLY